MKKYFSFIVIATLVLMGSVVMAESGPSSRSGTNLEKELRNNLVPSGKLSEEAKEEFKAHREAFRAQLQARRDVFKNEIKTKKEEFKKATSDMKRRFRENVANMIGQRFVSAFTNLERMQAKVAQLIERAETQGRDMDEAEEYLKDSKDKLAAAKAKLAEVKKLLPATGEQVTAEIFEKIKLGARETKDLVKESHKSLVEAIKEIRGTHDEEEESDED